MSSEYDRIDLPARGEPVEYDDGFRSPEHPIIPVVYGDGGARYVIDAARRVLDSAAEVTGRDITWHPLFLGEAARDRYGESVPADTIKALRECRVGLLSPILTEGIGTAISIRRELCRRLELYANVRPAVNLEWVPSAGTTTEAMDIVLFQDVTEDAAAGIEFEPGTSGAQNLRRFLQENLDVEPDIHDGPVGFGVRPVTKAITERLAETAVEYALDADRDTVTIVHQNDLLPATEGSFCEWAFEYLHAEYSESIITEERFDDEYDGTYPEDELVVTSRRTDEVCRGIISKPGSYDVLIAPALGGEYIASVAAESIGGMGVSPTATVGEGRVVAGNLLDPRDSEINPDEINPIGTIRSGCLLFESLGWYDAITAIEDGIKATLSEGVITRDLQRNTIRGEVATTEGFTDRVVAHIEGNRHDSTSQGVRTTPGERMAIKRMISDLYNALFEDRISPEHIELNQLRGEDDEADIYLPEVGINFTYWRRWSVERRLEVLLHELAHVENYDDDHEPSFYDRFVELTEIAEVWQPELEASFGTDIDFAAVKRHIIESVHEDTIEPDIESVEARRRALEEAFGMSDTEYY